MFSRSILGACALVLATGCATNNSQQVTPGSVASGAPQCRSGEPAAIMDVGSSGPSMKIACVLSGAKAGGMVRNSYWLTQPADGEDIEIKPDTEMNFGDNINAQSGNFETGFIETVKQQFPNFCAKAKKYNPVEFRAVATHAFRKAGNAKMTFQTLVSDCIPALGPTVRKSDWDIVSQRGEGILEYIGVTTEENLSIGGYHVVWGVGSNSTQISVYNRDNHGGGTFEVAEGDYASESFWRYVISSIKNEDPQAPNYKTKVTKEEFERSWKYAKTTAKNALKENPVVQSNSRNAAYTIYGIGGTLQFLTGPIDNKPTFDSVSIKKAVERYFGKEENEMPGHPDFKKYYLTNHALGYGYLKELAPGKAVTKSSGSLIDGLAVVSDWSLVEPAK